MKRNGIFFNCLATVMVVSVLFGCANDVRANSDADATQATGTAEKINFAEASTAASTTESTEAPVAASAAVNVGIAASASEAETPIAVSSAESVGAGANADISYEEGTSPADEIVRTSPVDKVLLVVSFGTSFNQSRSLTIGGIEAALQAAYPDYQVRRAFTSQIIIDKLDARDQLRIDNIERAMERLILDQVKEVVIQPTTVMSGYEYDDVVEAVTPYREKFESFAIGKPLLIEDQDYDAVAELMVKETESFRNDGTAIVYMGHGTEHEANETYQKLQGIFKEKGYNDYLIGTVEAEPTLESVQAELKKNAVKKVVLRPLMIVAGDHANNDMASDEADSWKTILTNDGYQVETVIEGLGQVKGLQDLFVRHAQDAIDQAVKNVPTETGAAATAAAETGGLAAAQIPNGTYAIDVDSSASMFKIVDCQLTVKDGKMSAVMTLSGTGFTKLYMGKGEAAIKDAETNIFNYMDNNGRHAFTVPVSALDTELDCAGFSGRREQWYDHTVTFKSEKMAEVLPAGDTAGGVTASNGTDAASTGTAAKAADSSDSANSVDDTNAGSNSTATNAADSAASTGTAAAEPSSEISHISVTLTGGTGRTTVQSPAELTVKDGINHAKIIWSSPNYSYMLVNGTKYLPVNTEGDSTFVIPIELDKDMPIIGCTTAMSAPKEIEYTLRFDSSTIK